MRKVIGIGETVLDIIFKGGKPIEAVPGSFFALNPAHHSMQSSRWAVRA